MSTPAEWIKSALKDLGQYSPGEALAAADQEDARLELNKMLDSWSLDKLLVAALTRTTKVLTGAVASYTIGSGGDINVTQPVKIENAGIIAANDTLEAPMRVFTSDEWARTVDKTSQGLPYGLYLQRTANSTNRGTIYLVLVPDAGHTLVLYLHSLLTSVAASAVGTTYYLLPGYELAISSNLAVALAPSYGASISQELALKARDSKTAVKSSNVESLVMRNDTGMLNNVGPGRLDISIGGWIGQ